MFIRGLIGAIMGFVVGAAAGAVTFGWNASMAVGSSWIGATRNFWPLEAYGGAIGGAVFGVSLGLYISLADVRPGSAALAGGVVGMIGVVVLWSNTTGVDAQLRSAPARLAPLMLSLIIWVLIGLLLSVVATKLRKVGWGH